eukprot:TRINITY_DN10072_c0_g1_i2.p1 TRINITY_DN10072_c0_g1~~TRINITY_DN10072_c0_g1_i2.p1  ORF type:complete len:544 (+),score=109.78 TRINITY_DN10072_c0_g1_i2:78-1709(+)
MSIIKRYGWLNVIRCNTDGEIRGGGWTRYWVVMNSKEISFYEGDGKPRKAHINVSTITAIYTELGALPISVDEGSYPIGLRSEDEWVIVVPETEEDRSLWLEFVIPKLTKISSQQRSQVLQLLSELHDIKQISPRCAPETARIGTTGVIIRRGESRGPVTRSQQPPLSPPLPGFHSLSRSRSRSTSPSTANHSPHQAPSPSITPTATPTGVSSSSWSAGQNSPSAKTVSSESELLDLLQKYKKLLRSKITREGLIDLQEAEAVFRGGPDTTGNCTNGVETQRLQHEIKTLEEDQDKLMEEFEDVLKERDSLKEKNTELNTKYEILRRENDANSSEIIRLRTELMKSGDAIRRLRDGLGEETEPFPSQPPVPTSPSMRSQYSSESVRRSSHQSRAVSPVRSPPLAPSSALTSPLTIPASVMSVPQRSTSPTPSLPASTTSNNPLICHVCGNHFKSSVLATHIPNCLKAWHSTQKSLPVVYKRVRPPPAPSLPPGYSDMEYNISAQDIYLTKAKNRCTSCLQRFDGAVLMEHIAICSAKNGHRAS